MRLQREKGSARAGATTGGSARPRALDKEREGARALVELEKEDGTC